LGLSIVKGLTRLLNHDLDVFSREDEGSRFSVTVPVVAKIPPELTSVQDREDKEPDLAGLVMVFVENEVEQRETLTQYLNNFGCYVVGGGTAAEVIAKIEEEGVPDGGPHFVLSDYRLSGSETGLTAIEAIRERFGQLLPCAIITAETSPEILQSIAVQGIQLLPKPFEARQLATMLAKYSPRKEAAR
jgi:CheY-like chemotaxis protein